MTLAPTAPIPKPGHCRWCHRRLTEAAADLVFCPRGCHQGDPPVYQNVCEDCGREFQTGRIDADQCYECDRREHRRMVASHASIGRTYNFSRYGRGRDRS